jgi:putative ABC transport system permease protein
VKTAGLDESALPQFYTPLSQDAPAAMTLVVRTAGDPLKLVRQASAVVHQLDPDQPAYDIYTMDDRVARGIGRPRFEAVLVTFFAFTALFLAGVGIYGVVAHSTEQRTREIGIRMALGANAAGVVRQVMFEGLRPVIAGAAVGLAGALALGRTLSNVLFQVNAGDPPTFTLAAVVLTVAAIVACWLAARKAARIDPIVALRAD